MLRKLTLLSLVLSSPALAASQSLDCQTSDKAIVAGAGNSELAGIKIKYVDKDGKEGVHAAPVDIQPEFAYNDTDEKTITLVPVSAKSKVTEKHEIMHVTHKDGTECYGRQRWDDRYVQTYVLTGKNGNALYSVLNEKKVRGQTADGYIVTAMSCHSYGYTTAGGCFAEEGDKMVWENDK